MRFVLFYHSLISDWNHGNAHFLRGVVRELLGRGHEVRVLEPMNAWSVENLLKDHGEAAIAAFHTAYPDLTSERYSQGLDLDSVLDGVDVVLVHAWTDPALVARIGRHHAQSKSYTLLFHDTHHRSVTAPDEMARYDLRHYDGVLASGNVIRDIYEDRGWAPRAWTWHEAADERTFFPHPGGPRDGDLVWIGNWGDDERTRELHSMLFEPVAELGLRARVFGVGFPDHARASLAAAGITYSGWLPNWLVPSTFGRYHVTVHVPRRPYVAALPGIPTIRMFEALACGIPLISAPWSDDDGLFSAGRDYLVARDGEQMKHLLQLVLQDRAFATNLAINGRATILARHTCRHRVDELFDIVEELS